MFQRIERFTISTFLVLLSLGSLGQLSFGPSVYFGRSNFPNEQEDLTRRAHETFKTEFGNSIIAGAFVEYQMNSWFSLQFDVLYDQLNFSEEYFEITNNPVPESTWRQSNERMAEYLSMPLTLQFNFKRLNAKIGYQSSILLSNYEKRCNSDPFYGTICNEGKSITLTDLNVSLLVGLSYRIYKGIEIEMRYIKGLANVSDNSSGFNSYASSTVQYLVGLNYQFSLKKKTEEASEEIVP